MCKTYVPAICRRVNTDEIDRELLYIGTLFKVRFIHDYVLFRIRLDMTH
jgi:hypothetical protein